MPIAWSKHRAQRVKGLMRFVLAFRLRCRQSGGNAATVPRPVCGAYAMNMRPFRCSGAGRGAGPRGAYTST
ncbi:hypothetical protein Deval_0255 [Nitratidesulfovibrio vulgaris RCH1]|nr:hypothetical protein Deval_0255 [Nitratidesulfovibrio vulgaris RCH1]